MRFTKTLTLYRRHLSRLGDAQQAWWLAMTRDDSVHFEYDHATVKAQWYWVWKAL